ncbi:hypothetical protein EC843_101673 [Buttiauxella sp. JUb87]|jgi:hypothetical protein|nr:hypothetical protein EC843_101673 [Buttiauxella sp. JUb87]
MNYDLLYANIIIIYYTSLTYCQYKTFEQLKPGTLWGVLAFIPFTFLFAHMCEFKKFNKNTVKRNQT